MDVPFLTLARYDRRTIPVPLASDWHGMDANGAVWHPLTNVPDWLHDLAVKVLSKRGDTLQAVQLLRHDDPNGRGNRMYRLDGRQRRYFLKRLGDTAGNRRELLVWRVLGFSNKVFVPGLPPANQVVIDEDAGCILTPHYTGGLRMRVGGAYELPMVLCLLLHLERTLRHFHKAGLVYMDLCPANILFQVGRGGSLLFYLTDMGAVKPHVDFPHSPLYASFLDNVIPRRWTRREVLPPANLFPEHAVDARLELRCEYDLYSLARVAMILLGMNHQSSASETALDDYLVENVHQATRTELSRLRDSLIPWLAGEPQSFAERDSVRQQLQALFADFFNHRCAYLDQMGDSDLRRAWVPILRQRHQLYGLAQPGMAADLTANERTPIDQDLPSTALAPLDSLHRLIDNLRRGAADQCVAGLTRLVRSPWVHNSRTFNYAIHHHMTLAKALFVDQSDIRQALTGLVAELPNYVALAEAPEQATLDAVRRKGTAVQLGVLRRRIQEPSSDWSSS